MSKMELLNIKGEKLKDINLKDNVWNIEPNDAVLYNAIINARAAGRQGTQSAKTRDEVSGGGRKPWKQKGTGNARQGSIRAPQWRGGGVVFAPKPRDYAKKMNKKERKLAFRSALAYKINDQEMIVIDSLNFETPKTANMVSVLTALNIVNHKVLVVVDETANDNVFLAARNLANLKVIEVAALNALDLVTADNLLITEGALKKLEEVLTRE